TVEELIRRTRLPQARVLWGRAPEQAGAPSYWPWIRALEHYATRADARTLEEMLAGDGPVLAYLVPAIRQRRPEVEPTPPRGGDGGAGSAPRAGATAFLSRAAASAPLLLVLEDLHWADEASLALLGFVAGELRAAQLLLVATCGEHEPHQRMRGFADAV